MYSKLILLILVQNAFGQDLFWGMLKNAAGKLAEGVVDKEDNSKCASDIRRVVNGTKQYHLWAIKMLDASGKLRPGILTGNLRIAGSYNECEDLKFDNKSEVKGKYCMAQIQKINNDGSIATPNDVIRNLGIHFNRINRSMVITQNPGSFGVCVPVSCHAENLENISRASEKTYKTKVHLHFREKFCTDFEFKPYNEREMFAIGYFIIIAILVIISTSYDLVMLRLSKERSQLLIAFSLYSNSKKLFSTTCSDNNLGALNGIRVLCLSWVILGHCFMFEMYFPTTNTAYLFEVINDYSYTLLFAGPFSVDAFFAIGGLLIVYIFMDITVNKGIKTNWITFYLHRFIRLSPSFYTCFIIYYCIIGRLGDGPFWFNVNNYYAANCNQYWWTTLLYIQNYYNPNKQCVTHGWYLSVDTQLYMLSPLMLIPLRKWPKRTLLGIGIVIATSMGVSYFLTVFYELGAISHDYNEDYFKYIYMPTHIRCTPWLVGAIWGYFLFKNKDEKLEIDKMTLLFAWIFVLGSMTCIALSPITLSRMEYNAVLAGLFNALVRPLWANGICWIIFACVKGYGGLLNEFLSMRIFTVLAKLNYSMYLVHFIVLIIRVYSRRQARYFTGVSVYFQFCSYFVYTAALAIIWNLCFESPMIMIEKNLINKKKHKQSVLQENKLNGFNNEAAIFDISASKEKNDVNIFPNYDKQNN